MPSQMHDVGKMITLISVSRSQPPFDCMDYVKQLCELNPDQYPVNTPCSTSLAFMLIELALRLNSVLFFLLVFTSLS